MNSRINRRLVALAFAVAVSALLQACAVTTGAFSPSRSVNTNHSMTSHYDVTTAAVLHADSSHGCFGQRRRVGIPVLLAS